MKEKLVDELLEYFINERKEELTIPKDYEEKRCMLQGVVNLRHPNMISKDIIDKESELLLLELKEKDIIEISELEEVDKNIYVYKGDITTIRADVIVNAGNEYGLGCFIPNHRCVDNSIHSAAGIGLRLECNDILKGDIIETGEVIICNGYNLPCKKVITTVGPIISDEVTLYDERLLSMCYKNSLEKAYNLGYKSIVFPSIATGQFGYPIEKAKVIAYKTVKEFVYDHNIKVIFCLYDENDYLKYLDMFRKVG